MPPVSMSQATIENLLRWNTDLASVNMAISANERVVASTGQIAAANTVTAASGGLLARAWNEQSVAARGFLADLAQIQAAEAGLTAQTVALTAAQKTQAAFVTRGVAAGGSTFGQRVTGLGRGLFNAPDIGGVSTPIARGLIGGGGVIDALGISAAQLGVAAGVAVPLVLGLVAVVGEYGKTSAQAEARAKSFSTAFSQALEAGTTAQVQALIKRQQNEIAIAEATQAILRQKAAESQGQLSNFLDRSSADLSQRLEGAAQSVFGTGAGYDPTKVPAAESAEAYNAQAEEQAKLAEQGRIALEAYNLVFGEGIIATGNATAAEQQLADVRKQLLDARVAREVNQANAELAAQRLTSDERQKRIAELGEEIPIQMALANTVGISEEAWTILNAQLIDMEAEYFALIAVTDSYTDRLARADQYTQSLTTQTDSYTDALTREIEAREDVFAAQQALDALGAENIARLQALYADRNERLLEAETEAGERRAEIAEDSADRIARITRDAGREQVNAIANRDSLANTLSQQQEADALADQKKADTKQAERLTKQLTKQEQTIEKSYNKQALQTAQAYDAEVATKRRGLQQAQVDLTNAVFNEQQIASYGSGALRSIQIRHWTDMELITNNFALRIVRNVQDIFGSLFFGRSAGASSSAYQIGYQAARDYVYTLNSGGRTMMP